MKYKGCIPLMLGSLLCFHLTPSFAQGLPPTNMGRWVQQPGDNQYSIETQMSRHPVHINTHNNSASISQPASTSDPGTSLPSVLSIPEVPHHGPDVSLEPITADEPVPQPGFPPMPASLDLPVLPGLAIGSPQGSAGTNNNGYTSQGGTTNSGPQFEGVHQHYAHYAPGGFQPAPNNSSNAAAPGSSGGYYKVRQPTSSVPQDVYSVTTGPNRQAPPVYNGTGERDLRALGKAPNLDNSQDTTISAPEPPSTVLVNQSTTQDLSLPDDDSTSQYFRNRTAGMYLRQMTMQGLNYGRTMLRETGAPIWF